MTIVMLTTILAPAGAVATNDGMWAQACPYERAGEGLLGDSGRVALPSDRVTRQQLANMSKGQKTKTYTL